METATIPNQNDPEFLLTQEFARLGKLKKELNSKIEETNEQLDQVEAKLMQMLDDQNKKSTAKFNGLGHVTCVDPTPFASIVDEETLFGSLKKIGRDDLIKQRVHTGSLTTLIRELLKKNAPIPEGCTYRMDRRLQFYPLK